MSSGQPFAFAHSSSERRTNELWSGWKSWCCMTVNRPVILALDFGLGRSPTSLRTVSEGGGSVGCGAGAASFAASAGLVAAGLAAGADGSVGLAAAAGVLVGADGFSAGLSAGFGA